MVITGVRWGWGGSTVKMSVDNGNHWSEVGLGGGTVKMSVDNGNHWSEVEVGGEYC